MTTFTLRLTLYQIFDNNDDGPEGGKGGGSLSDIFESWIIILFVIQKWIEEEVFC